MVTDPAHGVKKQTSAGNALEDAILSAVPPVMLPPLFAPSAGAFAAAAAIGFGFANQMAGAYLGFLKGAMESNRVLADALGVTEIDRDQIADAPVAASDVAESAGEGATILPMQRKKPVLVIAEVAEATETVSLREPATEAKKAKTLKPVVAKAGQSALKAKTKKAKAAIAVEPAPEKGDMSDLKRIAGIGPKLEKMLKARGFAVLSDIAALTPDAAEALDRELGLDGRIARDGWIAAASALK
jgi:NADH-quinone oxidoreductase subunit E